MRIGSIPLAIFNEKKCPSIYIRKIYFIYGYDLTTWVGTFWLWVRFGYVLTTRWVRFDLRTFWPGYVLTITRSFTVLAHIVSEKRPFIKNTLTKKISKEKRGQYMNAAIFQQRGKELVTQGRLPIIIISSHSNVVYTFWDNAIHFIILYTIFTEK